MCVRVRMTSWDIVSSGLDKGPVGTHRDYRHPHIRQACISACRHFAYAVRQTEVVIQALFGMKWRTDLAKR